MTINYKLLSIVLGILLLITICVTIRKNDKRPMRMHNGYHQMSDGSMMRDTHMNQNTSMHGVMMDMTANMQGKVGSELEKSFITEMIPHHQGAVDMANMLLKDPSVIPELKSFAEGIIKAQTAEISQMNEWLKKY